MSRTSRFAAAIAVLLTASAVQAAPQIFTYSGYLTDAAGSPITAASTLEFRFYSAATGPGELAMESVAVLPNADGYFAAIVGGGITLPSFAGQLYMSVKFAGDAAEMSPRIPLTSVPSAISVDWGGVTGFPNNVCSGATPFMTGLDSSGLATCGAAPASGGITGVTAGAGLAGGGTTGTVALRLADCATAGYVMKWDGTTWACGPDAGGAGTITSVGATPNGGITIAGTATAPTIGLSACAIAGYAMKWNGTAWACAPDANSGGTVTSVGATAPVTSTGGTAPVIGLPAASSTANGYLSSANWNIFNGKQAPLTGSCLSGMSITSISATGAVTCTPDQVLAFTSGFGLNPSATMEFIGPTALIAVTTGQKILVTASKALGSSAVGGASALNLYVCSRVSTAPAGTAPSSVGGGILGNQVAQNTRQIFTVSGSFSLTAGSYYVGLCGSSSNAANWNYNEYGYVTALSVN